MKKALLVLLLLAVAGGLFAQVTWNGRVYGGFRVNFDDDGDHGFRFWNNALGYGNQARLYATYRNDGGTLGGSIQFRANLLQNATPDFTVNTFYGWFTMFDKAVKINVGKWTDSEFNEQYVWAGYTYWGAARPGVAAYFYPADGLKLGVGLNAAYNQANAATSLLENAPRYWFGVAYEGDEFGAYVNGAYQKDNFNVALSGYYDADPLLVAVYADMMRLDDYANHGEIDAGLYVAYSGIVENLDADLSFDVVLYGDGSDTEMSASVSVDYYLEGPIPVVGISFDYDITGGGLTVTPYLRFGLSSSRNYLHLAYIGAIDFDASTFKSSVGLAYFWRF